MNTPTPAALLIDALPPKQRAILYCALKYYQGEMHEEYIQHVAHTTPPATLNSNKIFFKVAEAMRWADEETTIVLNSLFADCFHEDLDVTLFAFKEIQARNQMKLVS